METNTSDSMKSEFGDFKDLIDMELDFDGFNTEFADGSRFEKI